MPAYTNTKNMVSHIMNAINSFSFDYAHFCRDLSQQSGAVQKNFTQLCFLWMKRVAADDYPYDGRNECAHLVCKDILDTLRSAGIKPSLSTYYRELEIQEYPIARRKVSSIEELCEEIGETIIWSEFNKDIFFQLLLMQHRTLQQSFTRLCLFWIRWVARDDYQTDLSNCRAHDLCAEIIRTIDSSRVNTSLPLI